VIFIDTHCHLDAQEFGALALMKRARAAINNVAHCVVPAVAVANFEAVRKIAHAGADSYCLGIHPLYVSHAKDDDLDHLDAALAQYRDDPRLVGVGEIGLDFFVPELCVSPLRERQEFFYLAQLKLARKHGLPVVLHSRRSVDQILKGLRAVGRSTKSKGSKGKLGPPAKADKPDEQAWHGIAHAFSGSAQQAQAFIDLGLKLGFGGALTYERALQLRRLATTLPLDAIVLETDAPDMPPRWLYKTTEQRNAGEVQGVNSPAELPRIAAELAALRGISLEELADATTCNARAALPRITTLLAPQGAV
jgi:TatD DNase family protein